VSLVGTQNFTPGLYCHEGLLTGLAERSNEGSSLGVRKELCCEVAIRDIILNGGDSISVLKELCCEVAIPGI
jgi:hypothetical protein